MPTNAIFCLFKKRNIAGDSVIQVPHCTVIFYMHTFRYIIMHDDIAMTKEREDQSTKALNETVHICTECVHQVNILTVVQTYKKNILVNFLYIKLYGCSIKGGFIIFFYQFMICEMFFNFHLLMVLLLLFYSLEYFSVEIFLFSLVLYV